MTRNRRGRYNSSTQRRTSKGRKRSTTSDESETENTEETTQTTEPKEKYSGQQKKGKRSRSNNNRDNSCDKSNNSRDKKHKSRYKQDKLKVENNRMIIISSPSTGVHENLTSITSDTSELPPKPPPRVESTIKKSKRHLKVKRPTSGGKRSASSSPTRRKSNTRKEKTKKSRNKVNNPPCCPLCTRPYECPVLLRCAHTFCKDCVTVFVEASDGKSFNCPVCLTKMPLTGADEEFFCPNFMILNHIENDTDEKDVMCSACDNDIEADYYCEDCPDLLCEDCADAHRIVKYTKDHDVKRLSSSTDISKFVTKRYFCTEHENEQLEMHCVKCEESVCRECALLHHHGNQHNCIPLKDAAKDTRETIKRKLFDYKGRIPGLQLALMDIKRVKKLLREQVSSVRCEITESIKRLITTLKERERTLFQNVDQVCKSKNNRLNDRKENILIELEKFEAASRVLYELEHHENNVETLQMKATIENALANLEKSSSNMKVTKDTFLLKSNEVNVKNEVAKHGEIFRVNESGGEVKSELANNKESSKREENVCSMQMVNNISEVILISDFEDNAISTVDVVKESLAQFLKSTTTQTKARKLRAKANWLIVKSRVNDIIKYGRIYGSVLSRPKKLDPSEIFINRVRRAKARKLKAKAHWLVVKSHLKEIVKQKPPPKLAERYISTTRRSPWKLWGSVLPLTTKKKVLRIRAVKSRARANWLLVRSRLPDITDYGRVTGKLPFNPKQVLLESIFRKKRESRTILRLRHYRAITVRARANWLLVNSRLKDIAEYPKKKQKRTNTKQTWAMYRQTLLNNRDKATRNKLIAGEIRAHANWLIVKTRLPDIILYGMYQKYAKQNGKYCVPPSPSQGRDIPVKRSHSTSPIKRLKQNTKGNTNDLRSRSTTPIKSPEKAAKNWDNLINGTYAKSKKDKKSLEEATKDWGNLIYGTYTKSRKSPDKNNPQHSTSPSKSPEKVTKDCDTFIRQTYTKTDQAAEQNILARQSLDKPKKQVESERESSLKNWNYFLQNPPNCDNTSKQSNISLTHCDDLIKETPKKAKNTSPYLANEASQNWVTLTKELPALSKVESKSAESLNNWDKLITSKPTGRPLSREKVRDLQQLVAGTLYERPLSGKSKMKVEKDWDRRVARTAAKPPRNTQSKESASDNWRKLKVSLGRSRSKDSVSEVEKQWDLLVSKTSPQMKTNDEKIQKRPVKEYSSAPDLSISGKDQLKATHYWHTLVDGTKLKRSSSNDSLLKKKNASSNDSILKKKNASFNNWNTLIAGTEIIHKTEISKPHEDWDRLLSRTSSDKVNSIPYTNWNRLVSGSDVNSNSNKAAYQNWFNLIFGTPSHKDTIKTQSKSIDKVENNALINWDQLIKSSEKDEMGKEAFMHWDKLIEGKIIRPIKTIDPHNTAKHWDVLIASPAPSRTSQASRASKSSTKSSVFKNWHKLTSKTPPSGRSKKLTSKAKDDAFRKWEDIIRTNEGNKEDISYENWTTLIAGKEVYESFNDQQPFGVKTIFEKRNPTPNDVGTKILTLNVRNSKGEFHDISLKVSSPDKSILSAHIEENSDGTFTIFSCPRIDNDFNLFVSLYGSEFKHEIKVLNFYGSFAGLSKNETDLACRTISLLRWHLTPGLLTKKGDRIVARRISTI